MIKPNLEINPERHSPPLLHHKRPKPQKHIPHIPPVQTPAMSRTFVRTLHADPTTLGCRRRELPVDIRVLIVWENDIARVFELGGDLGDCVVDYHGEDSEFKSLLWIDFVYERDVSIWNAEEFGSVGSCVLVKNGVIATVDSIYW